MTIWNIWSSKLKSRFENNENRKPKLKVEKLFKLAIAIHGKNVDKSI